MIGGRIYLVFICWVGTAFILQGQVQSLDVRPELNFQQILKGLSQSNARNIIQDSLGYVWIGTDGGLNRFDGQHIDVFEHDPQDSTSIADDRINDMLVDPNGNLWIATYNALSRYDQSSGAFYTFQQNLGLETLDALTLHMEKGGRLWVGTLHGLFFLEPGDDQLRRSEQFSGFDDQVISKIYRDTDQNFWLGTGDGVTALGPDKSILTLPDSSAPTSLVRDILEDHRGIIWVATEEHGLYRLQKEGTETGRWIRYAPQDGDRFLGDGKVFSLWEDRNNSLWVGTERAGLNLYLAESDRFVSYQKDLGREGGLKSNSIWEVFEDEDGRLWLGSNNQGVFLFDPFREKFSLIKPGEGTNLKLKSNTVTGFLEHEDRLWIATDGGGITIWDRQRNSFEFLNYLPQVTGSLGSDEVLYLFKDSEGTVWSGNWAGGLNRWNSDSREFTWFKSRENDSLSIGSNNVFAIDEDSRGDLWLATWGYGLSRYSRRENQFFNIKYVPFDDDFLSYNLTYDVEVDDLTGDIWVATVLALDRITMTGPTEFEIRHYRPQEGPEPRISGAYSHCIYEDSYNRIWVGTDNGLNLFHRDTETFTQFSKPEGLPDKVIKGIVEDDQNDLWVTTNNGIARMRENDGSWSIEVFDESDGLQGPEFWRSATFKSPNGEIFVGGINGFNHFLPDKIQPNPNPPQLQFTDLRIFNQKVEPGAGSAITTGINSAQRITLNHTQSVFSMEFHGINFTHPEKNQYAFMLEGLETEWNYVGNRNLATYTNLDPGIYRFLVKAANSDGIWTPSHRSISIEVLPPWWETWWLKLGVVASLLLLALVVFRARTSVIRRRQRILEEQVKIRTGQVVKQKQEIEDQASQLQHANDQKNKLFSIIAHDLKNPLASLKGITSLLDPKILEKEDLERTRGEISQRISDLERVMSNLLDWARGQMEGEKIEPQTFALAGICQEMAVLYQNALSKKGLYLQLNVPEKQQVYADKDQLRIVLRNLVGNAIKFSRPGGTINIASQQNAGNDVTLEVKDTGVGIDPDKLGILFSLNARHSTTGTAGEKGIGLGLHLVREFVEKNGGRIQVDSIVGQGTTFFITLPTTQK